MKKHIIILILFLIMINNIFCRVFILGNIKVDINNIKDSKLGRNVKEGILASSVAYNAQDIEIKLKANEEIIINIKENYIISGFLEEDVEIVINENIIKLAKDTKIQFSKKYKGDIFIRAAYLSEDQMIKIGDYEINCKSKNNSNDYDIYFNYNNEIESIVLMDNQELNIGEGKYTFLKESNLKFTEGKIIGGTLIENTKIKIGNIEYPVKGGDPKFESISFNKNGYIAAALLYNYFTISTYNDEQLVMKKNTMVLFFPSGSLKMITIGRDTIYTINGVKYQLKVDDKAYFDIRGFINKVIR